MRRRYSRVRGGPISGRLVVEQARVEYRLNRPYPPEMKVDWLDEEDRSSRLWWHRRRMVTLSAVAGRWRMRRVIALQAAKRRRKGLFIIGWGFKRVFRRRILS